MGHREPHHAQQNPTELQEYLTNPSNHSTNTESHGEPLKIHQEGMHGPAQDTGQRGVKMNRTLCILASEEATRPKGDMKDFPMSWGAGRHGKELCPQLHEAAAPRRL